MRRERGLPGPVPSSHIDNPNDEASVPCDDKVGAHSRVMRLIEHCSLQCAMVCQSMSDIVCDGKITQGTHVTGVVKDKSFGPADSYASAFRITDDI
jgi:hypothetical protein